ncbi:MAG: type II toxin-antitoxin system PemK/MazF family toxin [Dehalococcoidia bacterium]|nr:type II toxin-antitoxin system PemK/MazF family toxin [Dehalococcoidia bacterium]
MAPLLRCEIRWADIDPVRQVPGREPGNRRPALILSNDRFNATSSLVIVALISASQANVNRPQPMQVQSVQNAGSTVLGFGGSDQDSVSGAHGGLHRNYGAGRVHPGGKSYIPTHPPIDTSHSPGNPEWPATC